MILLKYVFKSFFTPLKIMARMYKVKRSETEKLGIFDLKKDRTSFKVRLGKKIADVVLEKCDYSTEYNVLGIRVPHKGYEGLENSENKRRVEEAVDYIAYISRIKDYGVKMLLSGNTWTRTE